MRKSVRTIVIAVGVLVTATTIGGIAESIDSDDGCPTVKLTGFPTGKGDVHVTAGKTTCDGSDAVLPVEVTNRGDAKARVSLALRLRGAEGGSELETVLIRETIAPGKTVSEEADIYAWGSLDGQDKLTAKPAIVLDERPGPGGSIDMPDLDKPRHCNRKWYC